LLLRRQTHPGLFGNTPSLLGNCDYRRDHSPHQSYHNLQKARISAAAHFQRSASIVNKKKAYIQKYEATERECYIEKNIKGAQIKFQDPGPEGYEIPAMLISLREEKFKLKLRDYI